VVGSCEHGNELPGSIKYREILEWLCNCWLLSKVELNAWSELLEKLIVKKFAAFYGT
jgi:hypothetical protein